MTGVTLSVALDDLGIEAHFGATAQAAEAMTDLMDLIGTVLVNGARERIAVSNQAPDGTPWPPSLRVQVAAAAETEEGKPVDITLGGKTLYQSGALANSLTAEAAPTEVKVGSNMIYAGVHQTGATIRAKTAKGLHFTLANGEEVMVGSVTIPRREYLGISGEEQAQIEDVTLVHFQSLLETGHAAA